MSSLRRPRFVTFLLASSLALVACAAPGPYDEEPAPEQDDEFSAESTPAIQPIAPSAWANYVERVGLPTGSPSMPTSARAYATPWREIIGGHLRVQYLDAHHHGLTAQGFPLKITQNSHPLPHYNVYVQTKIQNSSGNWVWPSDDSHNINAHAVVCVATDQPGLTAMNANSEGVVNQYFTKYNGNQNRSLCKVLGRTYSVCVLATVTDERARRVYQVYGGCLRKDSHNQSSERALAVNAVHAMRRKINDLAMPYARAAVRGQAGNAAAAVFDGAVNTLRGVVDTAIEAATIPIILWGIFRRLSPATYAPATFVALEPVASTGEKTLKPFGAGLTIGRTISANASTASLTKIIDGTAKTDLAARIVNQREVAVSVRKAGVFELAFDGVDPAGKAFTKGNKLLVLGYCPDGTTCGVPPGLDPTWMNQKLNSCYSRSVTCSVAGGAPLAIGCGCFAGDAEKGCAMALVARLGRTPSDITYGTGNGRPWATVCPGPGRFYSGEWADSTKQYYMSCSANSNGGTLTCSQSPSVTPR
jgi:hypothetical protein